MSNTHSRYMKTMMDHLKHMARTRPHSSDGRGDREAAQWAADELDRLTRQLAEAQAELSVWRASFPGSAEAVKRDAHAAAMGTTKCG
jgi:hypothetical protein